MTQDQTFMVFFGSIMTLMFANRLLFNGPMSVVWKRRLWPLFALIGYVVFLVFSYLLDIPRDMLVVEVPLLIVFYVLALRSVKFCAACGAMVMNRKNFLLPPAACTKCGHSFDGRIT